MQRCLDCGVEFFPPRSVCPECLGIRLGWVELQGYGTLHSWTEVHIASPEFDTPFVLALVDLPNGIGRITARVLCADPGCLKIGMPVRIDFLDMEGGFTLYAVVPVRP